jgi:predicted ATPase
MLIKSLQLTNLLSFGPETEPVELKALNVLIGANGAGKSNFLEALALLQATPDQIAKPIRDGGGIQDWLHKSSALGDQTEARIEALVRPEGQSKDFRYGLALRESGGRLEVSDEYVENATASGGQPQPYFYYRWNNGHPVLNTKTTAPEGDVIRSLRRESIKPDQSILAQRRDSDLYPELTSLADQFGAMRLYREWTFGRYAAPRLPQKTDLPNDSLAPDSSNLGLVINKVRSNGAARRRLIESLKLIYEGVEDVDVRVEGGTAQVFLVESAGVIPATRLSDGTLRYLSLLTLLCDPSPPPLVAIEEPELGLHPDILPSLAELLVDASSRTQLVVTTHAPALVDALTNSPESVVVCERGLGGSRLERLDRDDLRPWLEKFRLGELWSRGEIGGTRW